jgi:hypothetical protein
VSLLVDAEASRSRLGANAAFEDIGTARSAGTVNRADYCILMAATAWFGPDYVAGLDETRVRDDANPGSCSLGTLRKLAAPKTSLCSAAVTAALRTADLSCAVCRAPRPRGAAPGVAYADTGGALRKPMRVRPNSCV